MKNQRAKKKWSKGSFKNNGKNDKDINKLENELLNDDSKDEKAPQEEQLNDVKLEDLLEAHESFSEDPDLCNDSNIPSNWPPLDSELNFKSSVNDYNNQNFTKSKQGDKDLRKGSKNKTKSKLFNNQILANKASSGVVSSISSYHKNGHNSPKNAEYKESFLDINNKTKLNWTMPKAQGAFWNESRKIFLEKNNSTIKVKGKNERILNFESIWNLLKLHLKIKMIFLHIFGLESI